MPYLDDGILAALQRLDQLLERAVVKAQEVYGAEAVTDRYRGLYINQNEVEQLLTREPGIPLFGENILEENSPSVGSVLSSFIWLEQVYDLSAFDLDLLLIALAPEIELRYERLYAFLQDDVSRKRPSVDLALNLLCASRDEKLMRRAHFAPDAPLIHHGLLTLFPDANQPHAPLLTHSFRLDEQIVRLLLGEESLDSRLVPFCQLIEPAVSLSDLSLGSEMLQAMRSLLSQAREDGQSIQFYFRGPKGTGKRQTAEALAGELGLDLLAVNLSDILAADGTFESILKLLFREAWFADVMLYLEGVDILRIQEQNTAYQCLLKALFEAVGVTILAGNQPWVPDARYPVETIVVPFSPLNFDQRRHCWQTHLMVEETTLNDADVDILASRFRLSPGQIANAVTMACGGSRWRTTIQSSNGDSLPSDYLLTMDDLFTATRAQTGHDLAKLTQKVESFYTWDDIVVPEDTLAQLKEICQRVAHRHQVLGQWGFQRKLAMGKGVNALFAGPSGTGKTMAAGIIANELGLDLYKIDLSGVVSKYIGETEKNLDRIFAAAEDANAILFFDEADALFGKRSEVRDSHDRYANIEISYLLQKMEEYEGISILATNLRQNLDDAFVRRLTFTIHFPFPEVADRQRIWAGIWPEETPVGDDVDLDVLAQRFKLSGGNIKNVALAAAFLAATGGGEVIRMVHLLQATRREYQKMGKVLSDAELNGARNL